MKNRFDHILQFKVTLRDIRPPVWRRIQVPCTYTFWDLHVAIQDAMGWLDCHLHMFSIRNPVDGTRTEIGIPVDDPFMDERPQLVGWEVPIANYFTLMSRKATYDYDFGDNWQHSVVLEQVAPADASASYPACVAGRRRCPPEDCGGVFGYERFLEIVRDPTHEEYEGTLTWAGGGFDPEGFDRARVSFDDPEKRWNIAFGED